MRTHIALQSTVIICIKWPHVKIQSLVFNSSMVSPAETFGPNLWLSLLDLARACASYKSDGRPLNSVLRHLVG